MTCVHLPEHDNMFVHYACDDGNGLVLCSAVVKVPGKLCTHEDLETLVDIMKEWHRKKWGTEIGSVTIVNWFRTEGGG
jgi:hypothetical protein